MRWKWYFTIYRTFLVYVGTLESDARPLLEQCQRESGQHFPDADYSRKDLKKIFFIKSSKLYEKFGTTDTQSFDTYSIDNIWW